MSEQYDDNRGPGRPPKYPFRKMNVGDTVIIPGVASRLVSRRAWEYRPLKFKCRAVMIGGVMGVRVERLV